MNKHSFLSKLKKNISIFKNSLNIKILKKFDQNEKKGNKLQFISVNRVLLLIIIFIILSLTYLSIPILYNKSKIQSAVKNQLLDRYDIKFIFSTDMKYKLFPWPSYTFENVKISNGDIEFAVIKKLNINIILNNFFSSKNLKIKDIFIKDAKFNLDKENYDLFFNLLDNDYSKSKFKVFDSLIFFKNNKDEVLLINKIKKMEYHYDSKRAQNILNVDNEVFNIPYSFEIYKDKNKKKIFSKIKINLLKSIFESEFDYDGKINKGVIDILANKNKSLINFKLEGDELVLKLIDKMKDSNFNFESTIFIKPFFLDLSGEIKKMKLSYLIDRNSVLVQFLKTEIFNNQNLNISSIIKAQKILPYQNLKNLLLNIKIRQGLIDIDDSNFSWSSYSDFKISNSLIYLSDNNLVLNGKMNIDIRNYNEIYRFFQTPRNFRKKIENIKFEFNYNFDQEMIKISNITIDNQTNKKVGEILNKLVSQENVLQNRVYLKNLINKAIKAYSG